MNKKYSEKDINIIKADRSYIDLVDITQEGFSKNLILAANAALEFARTLVINELPSRLRYLVFLNVSYNGNPLEGDEEVFEEENPNQEFIDSKDVVSLLWRDGKVPEWINVSVASEAKGFTNIKFECCGRYTSNPEYIYHAHEGKAPFHVLGPNIPPGVDLSNKEKFKL